MTKRPEEIKETRLEEIKKDKKGLRDYNTRDQKRLKRLGETAMSYIFNSGASLMITQRTLASS